MSVDLAFDFEPFGGGLDLAFDFEPFGGGLVLVEPKKLALQMGGAR